MPTDSTHTGRKLRIVDPQSGDTIRVRWLHPNDPQESDLQEMISAHRSRKPPGGYQMSEAEATLGDKAQAYNIEQAQRLSQESRAQDVQRHPYREFALRPAQTIVKKLPASMQPDQTLGAEMLDAYSPIPALAKAVETAAGIRSAPDWRTGGSRLGLAMTQGGLGAMQMLQPGVIGTFGAGMTALNHVAPDVAQAVEKASNPFTTFGEPQTEIGRNAAQAADVGAQIAAYQIAPKIPEAITRGRAAAADALSQSTYKIPTSVKGEKRAQILHTAQEYGVSPRTKGSQKIDDAVGELKLVGESLENRAISHGLEGPTRGDLAQAVDPLIKKWEKSDLPKSFVRVLKNYQGELLRQNKGQFTIEDAIALKRNLQSQLSDVYAKQMKINPTVRTNLIKSAKSEVEQMVRKQLESTIPGYKDVNSEIHRLLNLDPYVEQAANRISNQDLAKVKIGDLVAGGLAGAGTHDPLATAAAVVTGRILTDPRVVSWMANKISPRQRTRMSVGDFPEPGFPPPSAWQGGRPWPGPGGSWMGGTPPPGTPPPPGTRGPVGSASVVPNEPPMIGTGQKLLPGVQPPKPPGAQPSVPPIAPKLPKNRRVVPESNDPHLIQNMSNPVKAKVKEEAQSMIAELSRAASQKGGLIREFDPQTGRPSGSVQGRYGTASTFPDWYGEFKSSKESILKNLQKIVDDDPNNVLAMRLIDKIVERNQHGYDSEFGKVPPDAEFRDLYDLYRSGEPPPPTSPQPGDPIGFTKTPEGEQGILISEQAKMPERRGPRPTKGTEGSPLFEKPKPPEDPGFLGGASGKGESDSQWPYKNDIRKRQAERLAQYEKSRTTKKNTDPSGSLDWKEGQAARNSGGITSHASNLGNQIGLREANLVMKRIGRGESPYGAGGEQFYAEVLDQFVKNKFGEVDTRVGPLNSYTMPQKVARLEWLNSGKDPKNFPDPLRK